jgi:thiol-disulfide isomerase/thioredoxin
MWSRFKNPLHLVLFSALLLAGSACASLSLTARQMNGQATVAPLSTADAEIVPVNAPAGGLEPKRAAHLPEGATIDSPLATRRSTEEPMIRTVNGLKPDRSNLQRAPEISSPVWLNSKPLTLTGLQGKVVVVEFWTFECINCRNTLPFVKAWYDKYRDRGLTIIGVQTPELSFERDFSNVKQAVSDYQIKYPVAIDGDYSNWNRYHVMAWPTWFILDKEGYIRYSHIGEGDYSGSEAKIQKLLSE